MMDSNYNFRLKNICKSKKILVVDDDPIMRDVLKELLISHGYYTCLACNGLEALSFLEETQFDLVITDLRMPKMGGLELFDEIANRSINIPVMFLTGAPYEIFRFGEKKRNYAGFLTKPFDLQEFLCRVESACKQQSVMYKTS